MGTEKVGACSARPPSIFCNLRPLTVGFSVKALGGTGFLRRGLDLWVCGSSLAMEWRVQRPTMLHYDLLP